MGPPLKAAENAAGSRRSHRRACASMGPPLKAAENLDGERSGLWFEYLRFNGAAAKSSGKCGSVARGAQPGRRASMGPPLKAAENIMPSSTTA